jgi:hypothetical protein
MKSTLVKVYNRLLADICIISGVHLDTPDNITDEWVLIEAPKLDKALLMFIETYEATYINEWSGRNTRQQVNDSIGLTPATDAAEGLLFGVPEWLRPLYSRYYASLRNQDYAVATECIRWIRQCLLFCYKAAHEPTKQQIDDSQEGFVECEGGIRVWNESFKARSSDPFYRLARNIIGRVICQIDWKAIRPSHGPGSVYPPSVPRDKSCFLTIYDTIQQLYPFDQYFCGLPLHVEDHLRNESGGKIAELSTIESKLVCVQKDSRGPRLICVHPKEAIWIQQGQRRLIESAINANRILRTRITFRDQTTNGGMALLASSTREYVTLDLKEASDRLSSSLVSYLFGWAYQFLNASRASTIKLLDGRVVNLEKYAPMGNATVFPVQSLVFWALVHAGIKCRYGVSCNDIYVFGDDIIYPSKYHAGAINGLVRAGLIPNTAKTFVSGFFRESCGVDAYRGKDVTPLRVKKYDVSTVAGVLGFCDLAKRLRLRGFELTASWIYTHIRVRRPDIPLMMSNNIRTQGVFEYYPHDLCYFIAKKYNKDNCCGFHHDSVRFNVALQRWEVRVLLAHPSPDGRAIDAWWHLQDSLLRLDRLYSRSYLSLYHGSPKSEVAFALLTGRSSDPDESWDPNSINYSDRGLAYMVPYHERLKLGWTELALS